MIEHFAQETLDPADWQQMRQLAHTMVDDMFAYLETVRERPTWQPLPAEVVAGFREPLPLEPQGIAHVYDQFLTQVLPYPMGNIHPRFWGWYMGNGTVSGAMAEFLAAVMNSNLGGGYHAAMLVEQQVIDWLKEAMGFPAEAGGLLVSGGSMANLVGLTVARNVKAGFDVRAEGLVGAQRSLIYYSSTEVHSSNQKAVELLGLGSGALRKIPVNDLYQIDIPALQAQIAADRAAGLQPVCIIGNAGTINTGAVDDLPALADLCEREGLWFHVDGAIGAVVALAPDNRERVRGLERADSVALDLHKWLHMPFEAGCVLVRDKQDQLSTFSLTPEYLVHGERGLNAGAEWFSDFGLQLSRTFRALKVWMGFKEHGLRRYGRLIDRNIEQAAYLARLIAAEPRLTLMAPVGLDIVCFRFDPGDLDDATLNRLNDELLTRIQEDGVAAPSSTTLHGRLCLRVAIANYRTELPDFDLFIGRTLELGQDLMAEGFGQGGAEA
jgi:glutamate/tyrosine decarboxylase-like PLP-dependent enzyme